jgi:hypothetical protein
MIDRSLSGTKKTRASMSRRRRYAAWPSSGPACAPLIRAWPLASALYPAFWTAAISAAGETVGGAVTVAWPVAKLTAAMTWSPTALSFFSTRAAHAAQVMPPTDSSIVRVPTVASADT